MAAAPVKSQPLHNFSLPFLKWGGNSSYRCRRPVSAESSQPAAAFTDHNFEPESEPETRPHRDGSGTSRNRFGLSSCYLGEKSHKQPPSERASNNGDDVAEAVAEGIVEKPWNLRPRKTMSSKITVEMGEGASRNEELQERVMGEPKSYYLRGFSEMQRTEMKEKRKFRITLSREDIVEDIFVMTGSRPARRPKKRPKVVQKQLDSVFPGLWLAGVTVDSYRVTDTPAKR